VNEARDEAAGACACESERRPSCLGKVRPFGLVPSIRDAFEREIRLSLPSLLDTPDIDSPDKQTASLEIAQPSADTQRIYWEALNAAGLRMERAR